MATSTLPELGNIDEGSCVSVIGNVLVVFTVTFVSPEVCASVVTIPDGDGTADTVVLEVASAAVVSAEDNTDVTVSGL